MPFSWPTRIPFCRSGRVSPIDRIPLLGDLDDVPLGIMIAIRLIPRPVMSDKAEDIKPVSSVDAVIIGTIWIGMAIGVASWLLAIRI